MQLIPAKGGTSIQEQDTLFTDHYSIRSGRRCRPTVHRHGSHLCIATQAPSPALLCRYDPGMRSSSSTCKLPQRRVLERRPHIRALKHQCVLWLPADAARSVACLLLVATSRARLLVADTLWRLSVGLDVMPNIGPGGVASVDEDASCC